MLPATGVFNQLRVLLVVGRLFGALRLFNHLTDFAFAQLIEKPA
jgi:hypothetical protein